MADSKTPAPKLKNDEIDTALVRGLADILNDTDLTEIEVERGDLKIRVAREVTAAAPVHYAAAPAPAAPVAQAPAAPSPVSMPSDPATQPASSSICIASSGSYSYCLTSGS